MSGDGSPPTASSLADRVSERFGVLPNFFCSAPAAPGLIEELWAFARSAYLDSPLPSLFKERLFVHLSRFCQVRYCIVRHVGFLIGQGRPAGDRDARPETVEQVIVLLSRPLPDAAALSRSLERLEAYRQPAGIPAPRTQEEADLIDALTIMFIAPPRSERARGAVRRAVGDAIFETLAAFLGFVRTAHYWTEMHPDLAYEPDIAAVLGKHPELARLLLDPNEAELAGNGEALRGAIRASEEQLATELAAVHRLQETSTLLIQKGDAAALYGRILDAAIELMRSDIGSIQVLDYESGELRLLACQGFDPDAMTHWSRVRADFSTSCGVALASGRRCIVPDVELSDWMAGTDDLETLRRLGIRAVQSTPLLSRSGRLLGMISTHWRAPYQPADRELRRLDVLARQAADLTERSQSLAALRKSEAHHRELAATLETRVAQEIAAREQAQARLAQAQRLQALGQLAGGIAHDFNNVIQAVQGAAGLITRRTTDPDRVRALAEGIMDAAKRGGAITRRLLAFARRDALRAEPVEVVPMLAGIDEMLSHTLGTGIAVRVAADPGVPALRADVAQLETVLVNLAANARDAMRGMGTLTLGASTELVRDGDGVSRPADLGPGAYVRLYVADNGAGMTPEVLARASEPFFTTKPTGHGTGLGLAMARGFAEQSGGGFTIESSLGEGTTVSLWFPVAESAPPALPREDGAILSDPAGPRARLLLVDDDDIVRPVLVQEMEAEGYAVLPATSADEALRVLDAGEAVDLLISDLSMPGMDGTALILEVQRRHPGLPAILLTGFAEAASGNDAVTLIRKPVAGRVLAGRVATLLEEATAKPSMR